VPVVGLNPLAVGLPVGVVLFELQLWLAEFEFGQVT
jgi:hypothetical protein